MVHCDESAHYGNRAALPILLLAIHYKKRDAMQHLFFCAVLVEPSLKTFNSKRSTLNTQHSTLYYISRFTTAGLPAASE